MRNFLSGLASEPVEIELVAYGPGITFLKKDEPDAGDIQKLESLHVHFVACVNAVRKQYVDASNLVAETEGTVEVVRKQEQGWVFIKAGQWAMFPGWLSQSS